MYKGVVFTISYLCISNTHHLVESSVMRTSAGDVYDYAQCRYAA